LFSHTEIKPTLNKNTPISELKKSFRIDNVILKNIGKQNWIDDAVFIQNRYKKGAIEARFSSVPIEYFHTAIEVKIQSDIPDSKHILHILIIWDLRTLLKRIVWNTNKKLRITTSEILKVQLDKENINHQNTV
jgi:hypothetical protein